jgi:hypothetical protein
MSLFGVLGQTVFNSLNLFKAKIDSGPDSL